MNPGPNTSARRTAWMAARARNAAKRGGLIAAVGLLAVTTTMLLLVLLPREMNRVVRARIDALPAIVDTVPLQANLTGAMDRLRNAEANLQAQRVAYVDRVASATSSGTAPSSAAPGVGGVTADQSDTRKELSMRVARARAAPLVENFRAVGEADLLRNDARARVLLDSLNDTNRDREAYAALGSPDARYAAMTARVATLGQRILQIAEQRLASSASGGSSPTAPVPTPSPTPASASLNTKDSARTAAPQQTDTTTIAPDERFSGDSVAERSAREALDGAKAQLQVAELMLKSVRESNARIITERDDAEKSSPARVPPFAMLVAALVTGLAAGYGVAFYLEVKRPRIADAAEVERVTDTRVIVHSGATRAAQAQYPRGSGSEAIPAVVDMASESYQLLHITLTGFGDTSREVQVVSNDIVLGATVGINLAAAAVRDLRATLLVDASAPPTIVSRLLRQSKISPASVSATDGSSMQSHVVRTRVGRDVFVDTLAVADARSEVAQQELDDLVRDHDFTVIVQASGNSPELPLPLPAVDTIICARVGVTKLDWLIARTDELRAQNRRVRAVMLWAARAPSSR
ncbi:MAG: hypothetical protein ABI852_14555 [Gemmatimonadaceae bacterium]